MEVFSGDDDMRNVYTFISTLFMAPILLICEIKSSGIGIFHFRIRHLVTFAIEE